MKLAKSRLEREDSKEIAEEQKQENEGVNKRGNGKEIGRMSADETNSYGR